MVGGRGHFQIERGKMQGRTWKRNCRGERGKPERREFRGKRNFQRRGAGSKEGGPGPGLEGRLLAALLLMVTPKGVLQPAACKASATLEGA